MTEARPISRELVGRHGTLVFGAGVHARSGTITRVGEGFLVARIVDRDRSPAGEPVAYELVVPIESLVYVRFPLEGALEPEEG